MNKTATETTTQAVEREVETIAAEIQDGKVDTLDSNARYLGYLARAQRYIITGSRYVAYTSDIGEAFRPVVPPALVTAGYAVSWAYLIGDVGYEGYKAKFVRNEANTPVGLLMTKRAVFQGIASMALPAFTIHSTVKYSSKYIFHNMKNPRIRGWGPTVSGLCVVPALPFLFDHPVEHVIDAVFERAESAVFGTRESENVRNAGEIKKEL